MENSEMAIEILQKNSDGDNLAPQHLSLVEAAVNGWLTPEGQEAFEDLYRQVQTGYTKPWFHGIEHLTQDHQGFVYWKGREVEHYSYRNYEREEQAALELAERCRHLESIGVEVTGNNVLWRWSEFAPAKAA